MYICGLLNCANKDSGAAIIESIEKPGEPPEFVAISEERLARVKNSYFSPVRSIKYCMDAFGLKSLDDIDYFVMDWVSEKRLLSSNRTYRKLENDYVITKLNIPPEKLIFADTHHLAHAASAYYASGYDESAVLVIDGIGSDMETISLYRAYGREIKFLGNSRFYGLGQLYTVITRRILMFSTGEEGKTMGLAPYGQHIHQRILNIGARYNGLDIDYSNFLDRLPESTIKQPGLTPCTDRSHMTNDYYARIAFEVQKEIEKALLHLAQYAVERTGIRNLCMAGGVALNCVANSLILDQGIVENLFVQPASSDTGIPLGLALIGYYQKSKVKSKFSFPHAYTARAYSVNEIRKLLDEFRIPYEKMTNEEVARLIADGNVIGWFTGASEYGPRALGHRSILADPRNAKMCDILNAKVKHREKFRPFAPSVLEEKADNYFKLNGRPSPFMLLAPKVYERAVREVPSIVHVDETARVQTVSRAASPEYYNLIKAFEDLTGTSLLLNTSFNDNGEPIVETPLDALLCFMRTNIDYLVLEGLMVKKSQVESEKPRLVHALNDLRDKRLLENYKEALNVCCRGYDVQEMVSYLLQESIKSQYYANQKALDDLEDKLTAWANTGKKVVVVCDKHHHDLLKRLHVFDWVKVIAMVEINDNIASAEEVNCDSFTSADAVLVLTYNTAFMLRDRLAQEFGKETFTPYGYFSRKLPANVLIPTSDATPNNYAAIELLSYEAQRCKDWNGFFETVRHRLGSIVDEDLPAKPMG